MERMANEMLRDKITNLLLARSGGWMQPIREMPEEKAQGDADAILAALGLDDWDAAVLRAANALDVFEEQLGRGWHRARAIAALEAALTCSATEGPQDG